jgi:hypothetical protein
LYRPRNSLEGAQPLFVFVLFLTCLSKLGVDSIGYVHHTLEFATVQPKAFASRATVHNEVLLVLKTHSGKWRVATRTVDLSVVSFHFMRWVALDVQPGTPILAVKLSLVEPNATTLRALVEALKNQAHRRQRHLTYWAFHSVSSSSMKVKGSCGSAAIETQNDNAARATNGSPVFLAKS